MRELGEYHLQKIRALDHALEAYRKCKSGKNYIIYENSYGGLIKMKLLPSGIKKCIYALWGDLSEIGLKDLADKMIKGGEKE